MRKNETAKILTADGTDGRGLVRENGWVGLPENGMGLFGQPMPFLPVLEARRRTNGLPTGMNVMA
jgi:hypothetical protein